MDARQFALRPEAGPVPHELLIDCQKKALRKLVAALHEARQLVAEPEKQENIVNHTRMSRMFFVSGEPGSGKSSIYLTLRYIIGENTPSNAAREKYMEEYPDLRRLAGTARWLEPIDLEVAGDQGDNLLAAVLVRISDALNDSYSGSLSEKCRKAIDQLGELANDIGIAWDGNLRARAPSLDPDSYSQEEMRAQRARLNINRRLLEPLDALSKEKCCGCDGETIFILPVDDFYLKPIVSLQLLRLLRMISVPRLFFLIMGDIKTMEALFFEQALADWTIVAGSQVFGSLKEQKKQEVLSRAREMSARYLRKLLPAGQRAIMNRMDWVEMLRYKPPVDKPSTIRNLSCLLSTVKIRKDNDNAMAESLLDFLINPTIRNRYCNPSTENDRCSTANTRTRDNDEDIRHSKSWRLCPGRLWICGRAFTG